MSLRIGYGTSNRNVRTGYGPGQTFSPNQLGGLVAWYDATEISGLADSASVTTWNNRTGGTAMTGTGLTKPTYKVNIQNGKPGILFSGASAQNLRADALVGAFSGDDVPCTMIVVIKPTDLTAPTQTWMSMAQEVSTNPINNLDMSATAFRCVRRDDPGTTTTAIFNVTTVVVNTPYVTSYQFDGTNAQLFVNGTQSGSTTNFSAASTLTLDTFALGVRRSGGGNTNPYTGYIFEALLYNRGITTDERNAIEAYLGSKWGITVA